jgi:hypothetical protein
MERFNVERNQKARLLSAMKKTLQEYKEKKHSTSLGSCRLCWIYRRGYYSCNDCPMSIFKDNMGIFPCMNRRCIPINCYDGAYKKNIKLQAVQEFYEKAIPIVQEMTDEQLNNSNAFHFLLDIDNEVADKYGLYLKRKKRIKK